MANNIDWKTLIEDLDKIGADYDENDKSYVAIKYGINKGSAGVYLSVANRAKRGLELKANYNSKFLKALKDYGFNFSVAPNKLIKKEQPEMGLLGFEVTGEIESLHDEIVLLKAERDRYKKQFEGIMRSISLIYNANKGKDEK